MKKGIVKVLAIDPGLTNTGWALMECDVISGIITVVDIGDLHPGPAADKAEHKQEVEKFSKRTMTLKLLRNGLTDLMSRIKPDYVAVEDIFFNPQRPMAHAALAMWHCVTRLVCYDVIGKNMESIPTKIAKQELTGSGGNGKISVQKCIMLADDIKFKPPTLESRLTEHCADAIAVGYAFAKRNREIIKQEIGLTKLSGS
jgi:Holliday junction resolvasome RuvABC endonuclease subunit